MTDPTAGDAELNEYLIDHCYRRMLAESTPDAQRHWWMRMGAYLQKRTPDTVRRMEVERGLAR